MHFGGFAAEKLEGEKATQPIGETAGKAGESLGLAVGGRLRAPTDQRHESGMSGALTRKSRPATQSSGRMMAPNTSGNRAAWPEAGR